MNTYYVYITTNIAKTVLYVGMTNDLTQRIVEHYLDRNEKRIIPASTMPIGWCTTKTINT